MANLKNLMTKLTDAAEAARNDVEGLRDRLLDLRDEASAVRLAPITQAELRTLVDNVLDAAEADARSWCIFSKLATAEPGVPFDIGAAMRNQPLGVAALLLGHEAVADRLVAEAVASMPGKPIDAAVRHAELSRIAREIDDLERIEEKLLREIEAAGVSMPRRVDASPALYLAPDEEI